MNAMTPNDDIRHRVARIRVSRHLLKKDMASVMEGFRCLSILPVGIDDDFVRDEYIYTAYSPMFRALCEGESVPGATIQVEQSRENAKARSYRVLYDSDLIQQLATGKQIAAGSFVTVYKESEAT